MYHFTFCCSEAASVRHKSVAVAEGDGLPFCAFPLYPPWFPGLGKSACALNGLVAMFRKLSTPDIGGSRAVVQLCGVLRAPYPGLRSFGVCDNVVVNLVRNENGGYRRGAPMVQRCNGAIEAK
jgi:hypothetical protein